jgi:hypothetical protein
VSLLARRRESEKMIHELRLPDLDLRTDSDHRDDRDHPRVAQDPARGATQLTQTGRKARATLLRVDPTGMIVNHINIQCWVTFRLQPLDGGPITEGRKKMLINQTQMPRAGDVWPAWIDPSDPQTFAVGMPQGADPAQIPMFREFGIPHPLDNEQQPDTDDPVQDLQRLVDMKEKGLLTEDEFRAAKAKLLGGP